MKKNIAIVFLTVISTLCSHQSHGQVSKAYSSIETKNVLYYKVEEIVNMAFGGTNTRYTVSDLSLISKVELGPDNIRIITPIYKDERYKKKYYVETKNLNKESNREPTNLLEIAIESGKIEISKNAEIEQSSLALVISKLVKIDDPPVVQSSAVPVKSLPVEVKSEPQKEKRDFILVNVVYVYERVLEKGYKSDFMFKKVADHYYFKNQMEKAAKWYEELFAITNDLEPIYHFRFGDALKKTGNTTKGNILIEKFNKLME